MQLTEDALSMEPLRAAGDLGPLAWVLEELRKTLHGTGKTLRRFARENGAAQSTGAAALSTSPLEAVPHQLHQSAGALEMVHLAGGAVLVRAMKTAVAAFVQRPETCTASAAATVERSGAALLEFLEAVLARKADSAVALFPQYRDVQETTNGGKAHPADLWTASWHWAEARLTPVVPALQYDAAVRARLDQAVLGIVKNADTQAARELSNLCLGLSAGQGAGRVVIFWQTSAAFFEALALGLLPADLYVKRLASRILMQYSALSRGDREIAPMLMRDLLFYCAQAQADAGSAPVLAAVREAAFDAGECLVPVDYENRRFGRFEPALLSQVRKRIQATVESWSQVTGGDLTKLRLTGEHFHLLSDAMLQLQPQSMELAHGLSTTVAEVVRSGGAPAPALALEVATAVLYLQAAYENLDQGDACLIDRAQRMADRLKRVRSTGQPEPLETWMESLYRAVSERQTMASVVQELRSTLAQLENALDDFFKLSEAHEVPADPLLQFSQIRGVLSMLGLDQAAQAVLHLHGAVGRFAAENSATQAGAEALLEQLGNSLGALGFLVDMLGYQPALAKKLFAFDEATGELRPVSAQAASHEAPVAGFVAEQVGPEPMLEIEEFDLGIGLPLPASEAPSTAPTVPVPVQTTIAPVQPIEAATPPETIDPELLDIFLEEAREVVAHGLLSVDALAARPADAGEQTALRRAFHTLKGSSRMVGLAAFGEAAWAMEQLHNNWLAEQKPASAPFLQLASSSLQALGGWVEAIAQGVPASMSPARFQVAAEAMQAEGRLVLPGLFETEPLFVAEADAAAATIAIAEDGIAEATSRESGWISEIENPGRPADGEEVQVSPAGPQLPPVQSEAFGDNALWEIGRPLESVAVSAARPQPAESEGALPEKVELEPIEARTVETETDPLPTEVAESEIIVVDTIELPVSELQSDLLPFEPFDASPSEAVRIIGDLRVGIPLYQVYLGEADEWSRGLSIELSEWAMDPAQPLPESAIAMAHSLAGGSATVGFVQLSLLARTLERALGHAQLLGDDRLRYATVFTGAADEVSRLLHQFAAGFLKEADPQVAAALAQVLETEAQPSQPNLAHLEQAAADAAVCDEHVTGEHITDAPGEVPSETHSVTSDAVAADEEPVPDAVIFEPARTVLPEAASAPVQNLDDEIDLVDAIDPDLFPIFEEEALELLPQLSGALRQWVLQPENDRACAETKRVLHTLKGSARLAGALRLGEMAHRMESDIASHAGSKPLVSQIEPLLGSFDALQAQMDQLRGVEAAGDMPMTSTESLPQPSATLTTGDVQRASATVPLAAGAGAGAGAGAATVRQGGQSVRVRTQLLDRLVNQAGEIMMSRSRLEARVAQLRDALADLTGNLDRLRQQLRDVELQAETQMQTRLAQSRDSGTGFDPLEFDRYTRVQELTRMMAESVNDVATVQRSVQRAVEGAEDDLVAQARQSRELQRDLLRTRMVEFEGISERLYAAVRQASKDAGKQVRLDIIGGNIEMDRGMLDRLIPAFEHLLRNAVAHGIELPEQRTLAGKPQIGTISIELKHSGNDVSVAFRDDGAGLDFQRIRQKAFEAGHAVDGQALSEPEAAQLIFLPGFSTAAKVNELAGRGIGMDVVRSEVTALGGRIDTESQAGRGTGFTMVLPLTTAVTQVVMLRAGEQMVGVPATVVELVRRLPVAELEAAYANGTLVYAGESLPFYWSGALLQSSARSVEPPAKTRPVLIMRSASQRIALHVDEVVGTQEVVVKNLGPQLARLPGLAGMSVLASGAVALIYNPVALANVYGRQARQWAQDPSPVSGDLLAAKAVIEAVLAPLVLVVDDSITVRRVTQRLLQREGYRVALAADGLQALERLREELPVMVLSDIEMPRMDGFDLARNIRGDASMCDLPIVMITSRIGDKHREHAAELGVENYLGKPYSEDELLRLVRRFATKNKTRAQPH